MRRLRKSNGRRDSTAVAPVTVRRIPRGSRLPERDTRSHAQHPSRGRRRRHHVSRPCRLGLRRRFVDGRRGQRLAQDAHLLGLQPGREHRDRQEGAPARARQVPEADRHQGQAGGRPLDGPAQPHPHRDHVGTGPRRAQHRQQLERLPPGHRRLLPWDAKNFAKIGGKDRFVESALGSTGAPGKDPAAVPLYSMAYGLYYNKRILADAGIAKPPTTWAELVADGKKIQAKGKQVLGAEAPTSRRTSTTSSSSPSSTAPASTPPTANPTSPTRAPSPPSSSTSTSWPRTRPSRRATPSTPRTSR